jgi:tRNA 2-thiouridine synthesizing protein A
MADETLDCKGLICPRPLFETLKRLKKMDVGKTIEVLGDYPFSKSEITETMERQGQEVVSVTDEGDTWHILIKKRR